MNQTGESEIVCIATSYVFGFFSAMTRHPPSKPGEIRKAINIKISFDFLGFKCIL